MASPNGPTKAAAPRRIAVVGSGIAGLSAAYLLSREHRVSVFEREAAVGMDAHSIDSHGARMDIPLRVFSEAYYPNLCSLYRHLGIAYDTADYSFSCVGEGGPRAYFRYVNLFVSGMALPMPSALISLAWLSKYARLGAQFVHFMRYSPTYMEKPESRGMSLGVFLSAYGYSKEFAADLLLPMLSVVCTCSFKAVEEYPAQLVVDYFANKYGLSGAQCRAHGGTRAVVAALTASVSRVQLGAKVTSVTASASGATVEWVDAAGVTHSEEFDEVVMATQANVSRTLLRTGCAPQLAALGEFRYEKKRVVLHTDASLMPADRRDWSPLNISLSPSNDAACVTVWMNRIDKRLQSQLTGTLFQTWNPHVEPSPSAVEADFAFERPVVTARSVAAMEKLQKAQGEGHVWFVGAYARYSMPLLENGVKSAIEVASALGIDCSDIAFVEPPPPSSRRLNSLLSPLLGVAAVAAVVGLCLRPTF